MRVCHACWYPWSAVLHVNQSIATVRQDAHPVNYGLIPRHPIKWLRMVSATARVIFLDIFMLCWNHTNPRTFIAQRLTTIVYLGTPSGEWLCTTYNSKDKTGKLVLLTSWYTHFVISMGYLYVQEHPQSTTLRQQLCQSLSSIVKTRW